MQGASLLAEEAAQNSSYQGLFAGIPKMQLIIPISQTSPHGIQTKPYAPYLVR
jgi:hypothetical protein